MSGKLIVIEGLDGSGKATQSGLLADGLIAEARAFGAFRFRIMKVRRRRW